MEDFTPSRRSIRIDSPKKSERKSMGSDAFVFNWPLNFLENKNEKKHRPLHDKE
jgi:hypothetical protein